MNFTALESHSVTRVNVTLVTNQRARLSGSMKTEKPNALPFRYNNFGFTVGGPVSALISAKKRRWF